MAGNSHTVHGYSEAVSSALKAIDTMLFKLTLLPFPTPPHPHPRWGPLLMLGGCGGGALWESQGGSQAPWLCFLPGSEGSEGWPTSVFSLCPKVSVPLLAILYANP